jgi:hypothetical protein
LTLTVVWPARAIVSTATSGKRGRTSHVFKPDGFASDPRRRRSRR